MFKVRYKGKIYTVYHVEPRPILQFLIYAEKQSMFKSGKKEFQYVKASECEEVG